MKTLSAVLSSDLLTLNLTRFSAAALFRGLAKVWSNGVPSLINHDSHRLAGWMVPTMVSFRPGLTRLHGVAQIPENEGERARLELKYQQHVDRRIAVEMGRHLEQLRRLLAQQLRGDELPMDCGAAALLAPDLARRAAPELFALEDGDGLVPLRGLHQIQFGVYQCGDLLLFAHPCLRRSMSRWNTLNAPLLDELSALARDSNARVQIRLDPDTVGLASSACIPIELQYWYGPKFSEDLSAIPSGITRHEADYRQRYFHGISRMEFWWQSRDGLHIFEAEELRDLPTFGSEDTRFGCRYVHSLVEEATGRIVHLDGAIREYSEEELLSRMDQSIATAGRHTIYTKAWRVDGDIPLSQWKLLIHHHFRDNPLVSEYFGQDLPDDRPEGDPHHGGAEADGGSPPPVPSRVAALVPVNLRSGDSIHVLLSIHRAPSDTLGADRVVMPLEHIVRDGQDVPIIDADTQEIEKILRVDGEQLVIPDDALRLAFDDRYHTFPLIQHDGPGFVSGTIAAFDKLVAAWNRTGDDRVVTFSLGALSGGRELRVAVVGHVADLPKHFQELRDLFECKDDDEIANWANCIAESLRLRSASTDETWSDRLITPHATFRIARSAIDSGELSMEMADGHPTFKLRFDEGDHELLKAVREGVLGPALAWVITGSRCSKCGAAYFTCLCSKYLDIGVTQECTDASVAYQFWTDRPA